jgi:hypothetical protein
MRTGLLSLIMPSITGRYGNNVPIDIKVTASENFISSRLPKWERSRFLIDKDGNLKI